MKRVILFLVLIAGVATSKATITRVQSTTANTAATNATSLAVTFSATPTAGNIIVVAASIATSGSALLRGADQTGITWVGNNFANSTNGVGAIIVGRVSSTIASSTITLTAGSSTAIAAVACEYSGTNIRIDKAATSTNSGSASTAPVTGTTETTNSANELLVGLISSRSTNANTLSSPTNSFTIVAQTNTTNGTTNLDRNTAFLERIVTSTGTYSTGGTQTSQVYNGSIMTFEETPTGGQKSGTFGFLLFNLHELLARKFTFK